MNLFLNWRFFQIFQTDSEPKLSKTLQAGVSDVLTKREQLIQSLTDLETGLSNALQAKSARDGEIKNLEKVKFCSLSSKKSIFTEIP